MEVSIIQIGNSKGIRLNKSLLERYNIKDKIELVLEKDQLVIKPKATPRKGWESAFREMHETGEDKPLMNDVFEDENFEEWT